MTRSDDDDREPFVSTGHLPAPETVQAWVDDAHQRFRANADGHPSAVYPALAEVAPELFGICVVGTTGRVFAAGDADHEFTIMSVSKPFVFALVCELVGAEEAREKLGANGTGLPFNSLTAVERSGGLTNPMVNAGAIAATSLAPGSTEDERWRFLHRGLSRFAGRDLVLHEEVYASASATNSRNQSIARLLQSYGVLYCDPAEAVDLYTRQCSLTVTARDLAVMGATLADGGVNPITSQRVVDAAVCHHALAVMLTGGHVRDLRRLALRRRPAGQERYRRRDRHRLPRQGRDGHLRPEAGRGGQQRQGTARRAVPLGPAGPGPAHLAPDLLIGVSRRAPRRRGAA